MTFMRNLVTSKNKDLDTWLVTAWNFFVCLLTRLLMRFIANSNTQNHTKLVVNDIHDPPDQG